MAAALLIAVHLHDDRWHGVGDWPPSPMRLFQALLAGAAFGGGLADADRLALAWLETLPPPLIAAPASRQGKGFTSFVPNNDLDAVAGDPRRIGEIRAGKTIRPRLFDAPPALQYAWTFTAGSEANRHADRLCRIAERLYQFGRGVDMAYATADVVDDGVIEDRLGADRGSLWRPSGDAATGGVRLRCPLPGSLGSLLTRYCQQGQRLAKGQLQQPSQARFHLVGYDCPPDRLLYDLAPADDRQRSFHPWPLTRVTALVTAARDRAAFRLSRELPEDAARIQAALVGHKTAGEADKASRARIIPLPSIGHAHADPSVRRILIERPADCPVRAEDLAWAFSGLNLGVDYQTGEVTAPARPVLTPAADPSMLDRYLGLAGAPARAWQTVTPVALPLQRPRGRTPGSARLSIEAAAAHAVAQALRHAGITTAVQAIRVQREPFFAKGARAEAFADGGRFTASRLWHVQITFAQPMRGPLILGDGRYLGLGLMQPVATGAGGAVILAIDDGCRPAVTQRGAVVTALRRALMSRAADADGRIPTLFSGHDGSPAPARSGHHRHVYLFADDSDGDGRLDRLGILAPWRVDRAWLPRDDESVLFDRVARSLRTVRAGPAGVLAVQPIEADEAGDPLLGPASMWTSRTPYRPTRHVHKGADPAVAARNDLEQECLRRGLPRPAITLRRVAIGPRQGVRVDAQLAFSLAVSGPIVLGRDAHRGGGLFAGLR